MVDAINYVGRVTSASVQKHTGKNWDQWLKILTDAGAAHWEHKEIVAFLRKKKYKLGPWWEHVVAGGFETHIGRKIEGRSRKGTFHTTSVKALDRSKKQLWTYLKSKEGQAVWLKPLSDFKLKAGSQFETDGGIFGEVRTCKEGERARMAWQDTDWEKPSIVTMHIHERPKNRSMLIFDHQELASAKLRLEYKDHWKRVVEKLAALMNGPPKKSKAPKK